jgi:hypothetical protein
MIIKKLKSHPYFVHFENGKISLCAVGLDKRPNMFAGQFVLTLIQTPVEDALLKDIQETLNLLLIDIGHSD